MSASPLPSRHPFSAVACGLLYVFVLLLLASVLLHHFGFPLDDSWTHEVIARNFAETHVLGFRPGIMSAGTTSLLWTLILTIRPLLFPSLSPVLYSLILNAAFMFGIGFSLKRLTESDGLSEAKSWCFTLAPLASGNFLWFGIIGMEHLLFLLLSLCVINAWLATGRANTASQRFSLSALCFLLAMTRPEGIFLPVLLFLWDRKDWFNRRSASAAVGTACGWALTASVNLIVSKRITPLTMQGRTPLQMLEHGGLTGFASILVFAKFFEVSAMRLLEVWGYYHAHRIMHGRWLLLGLPLAMLVFWFVFRAVQGLHRTKSKRALLLCAWALAIVALYAAKLPVIGHGGRYISLAIAVFLPLVFLGLYETLTLVLHKHRAAWVLVAIFASCTFLYSFQSWLLIAADGIDQINTEHGAMGDWLMRNIQPSVFDNGQIAVLDIGKIGYQTHGRITDLGALVDATYLPYFISGRTADYLRLHSVQYVVFPEGQNDGDGIAKGYGLTPAQGVQLIPVHNVCSDDRIFWLPFDTTSTALQCERAFRVEYTDVFSAANPTSH